MQSRQNFKKLSILLTEYEEVKKEIEVINYLLHVQQVTDTVSGSNSSYPYTKRVYSIIGMADTMQVQQSQEKLKEKGKKLKAKAQECAKEYENLTRRIEKISDPQMRLQIKLRYREGLPWAQVARRIGGGNNADSVRKAVERFIEAL